MGCGAEKGHQESGGIQIKELHGAVTVSPHMHALRSLLWLKKMPASREAAKGPRGLGTISASSVNKKDLWRLIKDIQEL